MKQCQDLILAVPASFPSSFKATPSRNVLRIGMESGAAPRYGIIQLHLLKSSFRFPAVVSMLVDKEIGAFVVPTAPMVTVAGAV